MANGGYLAIQGECVSCTTAASSKPLTVETVPRGHVWLEGDNRSDSVDSRYLKR